MATPLILVPTDRERRVVRPRLATCGRVELCGFGMAAAAARTALLLAETGAARVLLVGIAGRLDERIPLGGARRFTRVACHGIGAGGGDDFVPAATLGWPQWPGDHAGSAIGDELACASNAAGAVATERLLLTVCASAGGPADVAARRRLFPEASAEDMEGFAVAVACRMRRVPFDVVRGISNTAGDRDTARWRVDEALEAAAAVALDLLAATPGCP